MDPNPYDALIVGDCTINCGELREALFGIKNSIRVCYSFDRREVTLRIGHQTVLSFERSSHERARALAELLHLQPTRLDLPTTSWGGERNTIIVYARKDDQEHKELCRLLENAGFRHEFWKRTHDYGWEVRYGDEVFTMNSNSNIMERFKAFAAAYPGLLEREREAATTQ